ncbi:MAG: hypothetical protein FWD24_05865 [Treponema sp.]|nr:hypothetical protein [Treponema sp.]
MRKQNFFLFILVFIMAASVSMEAFSQSAAAGTLARVNEARQKAMDFECPAYFPSDWENLENQYGIVSRGQQTAAVYENLAAEYDAIFKKTIPLYAQAWEDDIILTRYMLFGTVFIESFPELLNKADEIALRAMAQYEAEDYYTAKITAENALNEYGTLLMGVRVFTARQEILDRGFRQYDLENFNRAEEVAQTALNEYYSGNNEAAITNGEEALLRYNIILSNGWVVFSVFRQASAFEEREFALIERANIASRETFRAADALYNQASDLLASEDYNEAALLFIEAEAMYLISRQETENRRLRAIEAIRMAEDKIEESKETAVEAERIIEGGLR